MWWLLVVMLWPANGDPQSVQAPLFKSQVACDTASQRLLSDIAADRPQTIAAITEKCVMFSNPMTELKQ